MSSTSEINDYTVKCQPHPCQECPWQTKARLGKFPPEAFQHTADTAVQPNLSEWNGQGPVQKLFACHMSDNHGRETKVCAGFLAVDGHNNFEVRLRVSRGQIPAEALSPGPDWPELYTSHDDMARANGVELSS